MEVVRGIGELKARRASWARPVGLVPTMGYLHKGHLELVRRARQESATVVASIFVNPTQFGPGEDFGRYPRAFEKDLRMLEEAGTDAVFAPVPEEMYPAGFSSWVLVEDVTEPLEGASRPGHFRGVATVCNKLFNIVAPERAYFGQKDAQQVAVIRRMVRDLNMNLEVIVVPTVREPDGLAMSSRNSYLDAHQRAAAPALYRALVAAREMRREGCRDVARVERRMVDIIEAEPLAQLDYAALVDPESFRPVESLDTPVLAVLAVRLGTTRLIDNMLIE
ncbi:MAG: pantoate--beta-alanine ligase [Dehalococcoidia bacterium]|nr:pantoate--beta-alanine ligase [Dehalococcoidia bacterium]